MIVTANYFSPIGNIFLAAKEEKLIGLWLCREKMKRSFEEELCHGDSPILTATKAWLDSYFHGEHPPLDELNLAPVGSPFQHSVWRLLCKIPYGEIVTYGDLAKTIAVQRGIKKMSAQAVGGAVGSNPISIIIPCHRVVGANGNLTGYGGGIDKKIALLKLEGIDTTKYYIPKSKKQGRSK